MSFTVLDPTPEKAPPAGQLAPRLDTLKGKTIGFISNGKEGTKGFFAHLDRVLREELSRHGISFSQYQHLRQLWHADGLAQVELSRRIGIETASSTAVIDQLEKLSLIRRKRDAADRRRIIVTLTPSGRALEKPLDDCAIAVNLRARDGLSKAEVAGLFDAVGKIVRNLRRPRGL